MKKLILMLTAAFVVLSGCSEDKIVGTWVQPVPGMENQLQGMVLNKDGSAGSVNMRTLQYTHWQRKGNVLILSGQSIGNGQTIDIIEELEIRQLDDYVLKLGLGDTVFNYTRQLSTGE